MAVPSPLPIAGQKRGPGRPPKALQQPALKRQKRSSLEIDATGTEDTDLSAADRLAQETKLLPSKLGQHAPLPTLSQAQSLTLSADEYASVASSAVLAASLDRSRASWTSKGVFDRYWTKPETGKHAKPPPSTNPELKSMKSRGKCRLRIEPHIFEVEVWVVDKPRQVAAHKPFIPKQTQAWQTSQAAGAKAVQQSPAATVAGQGKKGSPDPVIGMLAARAGSDPELKALMREVAAGQASQEQLRVFQKHIDDLHAVITAQKEADERKKTAYANQTSSQSIQQRPTPSAPPSPGEVVFSFTANSSSPDRFLFPQHCILETLTPQHLLASFVVLRDTTDTSGLEQTCWIPVTMMVEVAYGREGILSDIRRWVKPAAESKEYMAEVIEKHIRAPERHLALRLPLKSANGRASQSESNASTPVPTAVEEKKKKKDRKSNAASTLVVPKQGGSLLEKTRVTATAQLSTTSGANALDATQSSTAQPLKQEDNNDTTAPAADDGRRTSGRVTRRSLRGSAI